MAKTIRRWAAVAGAAALTMVAVLSPASAGAAAAPPCNYFEADGQAFFHNCESDGIIIRVSQTDAPSFQTCAMPGVNLLGQAPPIRGALPVPFQPICG